MPNERGDNDGIDFSLAAQFALAIVATLATSLVCLAILIGSGVEF